MGLDGISSPRKHGVLATTTALVTGANKGIGYAICEGLGALGWRVGVGARDDSRRDAAVRALQAEGIDAFGVPLDVTDPASVAAAATLLETQEGRLDVLGEVASDGCTGDDMVGPGAAVGLHHFGTAPGSPTLEST